MALVGGREEGADGGGAAHVHRRAARHAVGCIDVRTVLDQQADQLDVSAAGGHVQDSIARGNLPVRLLLQSRVQRIVLAIVAACCGDDLREQCSRPRWLALGYRGRELADAVLHLRLLVAVPVFAVLVLAVLFALGHGRAKHAPRPARCSGSARWSRLLRFSVRSNLLCAPLTVASEVEHAKASPRAGRVAEVGLTPEKGRVSVQVEAAPVPGPRGVCDDRVNLASTSESLSLNQASKASCLLCTQELRCVGIYLRTSRSSASRTASCMWHAPASAIPGTSGSHCCPTRGDGQDPHTQRGLQGGAHVLSC